MDSLITIKSGLQYSEILWDAGNCIIAEQLATKLLTISRHVHGPEHKVTLRAEELIGNERFKQWIVSVFPDGTKKFQALQYKHDGNICVITGPVTYPRQVKEETILHVASNLIIPDNGCPVIFHGLISSSHLNGKLGGIRGYTNINELDTFQVVVQIENKVVKSASEKPKNLRIAFDLPSKD